MRLFLLIGTLLFTFSLPASVAANPVFPDEQSLLRGADVYGMHCAECHGWTIVDRFRERDAEGGDYDYAPELDYDEMINEVHGIEEVDPEELVYIEGEEEEWPEWAQFPDPDMDDNERIARRQTIDQITSAVDEVYGAEINALEETELEDILEEEQSLDLNGPVGGATELQNPNMFSFGTSEQAIYDSISQGTGANMPSFQDRVTSEEEIWDLVNFIRSFWPEDAGYGY